MTEIKLKQAERIITEVDKLRGLQKEFFKTHDYNVLSRCKSQEGLVDALIADYQDRQTKLDL